MLEVYVSLSVSVRCQVK